MVAALFPDNVAGQIVWVQLLCSVNTVVPVASTPNFTRNQIAPAYMQTSARVLPTTFCIMDIAYLLYIKAEEKRHLRGYPRQLYFSSHWIGHPRTYECSVISLPNLHRGRDVSR